MNVLHLSMVGLVALPVVAQQPPLTEMKFRELQQLLTPDGAELWRRIPWRIELLEAQREAAEQNKPLFLWAMDGHPLGCT